MKNTVSYDVWRGVKIFRAIKFSDVEPALALTLHPDLIYLFLYRTTSRPIRDSARFRGSGHHPSQEANNTDAHGSSAQRCYVR